jgi:pimeloyl-ACP methyl ester carboxylesterase
MMALDERRPSRLLLWLEGRSLWELASLPLALPWLLAGVPRGDGHSVLVLPGLLASDVSTRPLRTFLTHKGYDVHGWQQGRNLGPREGVFQAMQQTLDQLYRARGAPVSLVGWSLGGIYAREIARAAPQQVRQVITLGSPLYGASETSSNAWEVYRAVSGREGVARHERGDGPPPVPTTSIYTRADGIVGWGCCIEQDGPQTDNIEIAGASHTGIGVHPLALYAIGDRLAQPADGWARFRRNRLHRLLYPAAPFRPRPA